MQKWHANMEFIQFPLKILLFGTVILGIGNTILSPNLSYLWTIEDDWIILISESMRYMGGFIIQLFPLFVFIKVMTRKFEDSVPVFLGIVSIILMNIMILFLEKADFPAYFYQSTFGIQMQFDEDSIFGQVLRIPYNLGILYYVFAYYITKKCYMRSRHYTMHGLLSFIDHDSWAMILTVLASILSGVLIAYLWPIVIFMIQYVYVYISKDMLNPINMFLYGIMERMFSVLGLQEIQRGAFWFSELGGSATDNFGVLYQGDINTWYASQIFEIETVNAGTLITPYYVINMFIMPSFLLAYYTLVSHRKDRNRYFLFLFLLILLSICCGNPLPMELFMLILSPLLFLVYLLLVGGLYAGFQMAGVAIGYYFEGSSMVANPGSLIDILPYFQNIKMSYDINTIFIAGGIVFILFFFATRSYFKKYAIGLLNIKEQDHMASKVIDALGGIHNITSVSYTPDKLTVGLVTRDQVDFDGLKKEGAYLILESKEGYLIRLSNLSMIAGRKIKARLKEKDREKDKNKE